MFLLSFLSILMVATIGHVSSEQTLPIPMLVNFLTNILRPANKKYCHAGTIKPVETKWTPIESIVCKSANVLEMKFKVFGKNNDIMELMNPKHKRDEKHSNGMRLEKPMAKPSFHEFVTAVGRNILDTMTVNWHRNIAISIGPKNVEISNYNLEYNLKKKIRERWNDVATVTENEKLKALKSIFLTKVNDMKTHKIYLHLIDATYDMQTVAMQIYEMRKGDDDAKQLQFFLDLFVANFIGIEVDHDSKGPRWEMRSMIEP